MDNSMPNAIDGRFDRLETLIERGFAALASDTAETRTEITGVKVEVAGLREETHTGFAEIHAEIKDIRHRLDYLETSTHSMSGFTKEIDHLLERVGAIEKHLGLRANIAA